MFSVCMCVVVVWPQARQVRYSASHYENLHVRDLKKLLNKLVIVVKIKSWPPLVKLSS